MPKITIDDIMFLSSCPRVSGKVIIDDWQKTLKFENHRWIKSFEGIEDNKWKAPLTSRGQEIIELQKQFEKELKNETSIENADYLFN